MRLSPILHVRAHSIIFCEITTNSSTKTVFVLERNDLAARINVRRGKGLLLCTSSVRECLHP